MSRTYRKYIKRGFACGSNTEYYRNKRRGYRAMLRDALMHALENENPDEVFANPEDLEQFKDTWREPTDGYSLIWSKHLNNRQIEIDTNPNNPHCFSENWLAYCKRKWYSKLKNKH